jgi:hypothetical protein
MALARAVDPDSWMHGLPTALTAHADIPKDLSPLGVRGKRAQKKPAARVAIDAVMTDQDLVESILRVGDAFVAHPMLGVNRQWYAAAKASGKLYTLANEDRFFQDSMKMFWDKLCGRHHVKDESQGRKLRWNIVVSSSPSDLGIIFLHIDREKLEELNLPLKYSRMKKRYGDRIFEEDKIYQTRAALYKALEHTNGMWGLMQRRCYSIRKLKVPDTLQPTIVWHPDELRARKEICDLLRTHNVRGGLNPPTCEEIMRCIKLTKPIYSSRNMSMH